MHRFFLPFLGPLLCLTASAAEFDAPKFGLKANLPDDWPIAVREKNDRIFVALIRQDDPDRPGVVACELGLAPESLDEYRTRIDANAAKTGKPGGKLVRNEVIDDAKSKTKRLETVWEFRPGGNLWHERSVRVIANRQLYTFILNVDDATYTKVKPTFETLLDSVTFSPPNTGADRIDEPKNRWRQREFQFAIDLPKDWAPALAPDEIALFYANGPSHGIWADNVLVIAHPKRNQDLAEVRGFLPDALRNEDPNCEILSCEIIKQGETDALETVVRTKRGPFSMTILERRFSGDRFDYEVKYTVESKRFDALAPSLRKGLDSFSETPGAVAAPPGKAA
jgi:hypothetical protein